MMAERQRGFWDRFSRRRADPADVQKLNQVLNTGPLDWDGKDLASLSKIQASTNRVSTRGGAITPVDYGLLRTIANKSEVVNAILRRAVDDTLSNGYRFRLAEGKDTGDATQLERAREFFKRPNPDDMGDEWLETMLFDLILFGDAYLELDGSEDNAGGDRDEDWNFGGKLVSIWPIEADTMKIIPAKQLPAPPEMAYIQSINKKTRRFSRDKVLHIAKFKQGRGYGSSPLIPLLEVITGQLNLSNYLNALYTGTLPKTILNVGDISNAEMKAMLGLIEQQLAGGQSPFGLIAINGGSGFNMHRLIDSTREGAQLDLLYYYREEICAVFGIPPMKLGWVQTGKLANPEQQLDSWYDVVESYHHRVSTVINNNILPLLDISDWEFEFISIRPKQDAARAETFNNNSNAISTLRQEATISINEARSILGLERIESTEADDPFFISPALQINQPDAFDDEPSADDEPEEDGDENLEPAEPELGLLNLFPPIGIPEDAGKGAGESPWFEEVEVELSDEDRLIVMNKRTTDADEFLEIEEARGNQMIEMFSESQQAFSDQLMKAFDGRFRNSEIIASKDLSASDLSWAVDMMDSNLETLMDSNLAIAGVETMGAYQQTLGVMNAGTATTIAFGAADAAVLSYWQRRWVLPALRNTLNGYRSRIIGVFSTMATTGRSWKWASAEMRRLIDPSGDKYPKGYYDRIARTEIRRCVETAHISGLSKTGIKYTQRLVEIDTQTDKDLCLPFGDAKYRVKDAAGVLPAHPNCRCTMVGFIPDADFDVIQNPLKPEVPQPTKGDA
jgi:phage portal protein BeeE